MNGITGSRPQVPPEQCDFCFSDRTTWVVPAGQFEESPARNGSGNWGACNGCAELIRQQAWSKLVIRVKKQWPVVHSGNQMPPEVIQATAELFQKLRQHITGPVVRIES